MAVVYCMTSGRWVKDEGGCAWVVNEGKEISVLFYLRDELVMTEHQSVCRTRFDVQKCATIATEHEDLVQRRRVWIDDRTGQAV